MGITHTRMLFKLARAFTHGWILREIASRALLTSIARAYGVGVDACDSQRAYVKEEAKWAV